MNWREKMPPALAGMFSIFHQDFAFGNPTLDELADDAIGHLKADERAAVAEFMTELLASEVTRGELRTLMKKAGVRDIVLTNPRPLFQLIRDKLNEPEEAKRKRERTALIATVREILLKDWDPIGIDALFAAAREKLKLDFDPASAADKYDSYIGGVVRLLDEKSSVDRIFRHLREIEETQMGIVGDNARTWAAAEKLAALAGKN